MDNKSPDAFRTISEVADWLGVPTHVLRFWESRFTEVAPVKRAGGRRYYRRSDMELLGGIRKLLHVEGLTIRGVRKLLREQGVSYVTAMSPPIDSNELSFPQATNVVPLERVISKQTDAKQPDASDTQDAPKAEPETTIAAPDAVAVENPLPEPAPEPVEATPLQTHEAASFQELDDTDEPSTDDTTSTDQSAQAFEVTATSEEEMSAPAENDDSDAVDPPVELDLSVPEEDLLAHAESADAEAKADVTEQPEPRSPARPIDVSQIPDISDEGALTSAVQVSAAASLRRCTEPPNPAIRAALQAVADRASDLSLRFSAD